jgi:prevent-host-death family protein
VKERRTLLGGWPTCYRTANVGAQLQDAKAQFSAVVHAAEQGQPQCVSRHGKDAVIILSYDAFMEAVKPKQNLFEFFRNSPLTGSNIELERLGGTLREVEI